MALTFKRSAHQSGAYYGGASPMKRINHPIGRLIHTTMRYLLRAKLNTTRPSLRMLVLRVTVHVRWRCRPTLGAGIDAFRRIAKVALAPALPILLRAGGWSVHSGGSPLFALWCFWTKQKSVAALEVPHCKVSISTLKQKPSRKPSTGGSQSAQR